MAVMGSAMTAAQATPAVMSGERAAANNLNVIERVQFLLDGQEYCWYDDGWHGPGWYWCGYALRQGLGWGGAKGWQHWDRHHPPRPVHGAGSSHNPTSPVKGRTPSAAYRPPFQTADDVPRRPRPLQTLLGSTRSPPLERGRERVTQSPSNSGVTASQDAAVAGTRFQPVVVHGRALTPDTALNGKKGRGPDSIGP